MTGAKVADVDAIALMLRARTQALYAKDAAALTVDYAADLLTYDLAPPLATRGVDRPALAKWLAGWDGPITSESRDLSIAVGDDVAFSTGLNRMCARAREGKSMMLWVRTTLGYGKIDGRWRIVHEHVSVPFYMDGSESAALDLKP
jgi:ketosteroid isomerase-like protein